MARMEGEGEEDDDREGDIDAVLAQTKPDLLFDVVIPAARKGVVETGLRHNCHVLSEKPMATRWEDGKRMVAACELILEGLAAQKRISRSEELGYTRSKPERREPGYGKGGISFG